MVRLEYEGKKFKIINEYEINNSSREVTFSDVTIDFTGHKKEELPINFEEVHIIKDENIIYTGYVNSFNLPSMKNQNQYIELSLNLLSPMQMATNKVVTIIGTYTLKNVINKVFEPMILDGYVIKEMNVRDGQKTVSFLMETIEYVMNALSHSENIWWYINEKKEIFVNSLDYQFGLKPVMKITHNTKIKGLLSVLPSVEAVNYANVLNVKNARVYVGSSYFSYDPESNNKRLTQATKLKKGDTIDFAYPVDISEDTIRKRIAKDTKNLGGGSYSAFYLGTNSVSASISIDTTEGATNYNKYVITDNIGFDNEDNKMFILKRDNFFKNLIVGLTYKGENELTIDTLMATALEYKKLKLVDSQEIEKNKGKISASGVIEKTIDMNGRWFFDTELIDEARSMMSVNSNQTNIVKLEFDYDHSLKMGNIIFLDLPNFFTQGNFIITDITYTKSTIGKWLITLRSSDVLENYIDLFREKQAQESDEQEFSVMFAEYIEEKINEKHEVIEIGEN